VIGQKILEEQFEDTIREYDERRAEDRKATPRRESKK
jgi:hypothetical protein